MNSFCTIEYFKLKNINFCFLVVIILASTNVVFGQFTPLGSSKDEMSIETSFIEGKKQVLIGRPDLAKPIFEKLLEKDRSNSTINFELAKIFVNEKNDIAAEKYIESAVKHDPSNVWYLEYYGDFLERRDYSTKAFETFNKLSDLEPTKIKYIDRLIGLSLKYRKYQIGEEALVKLITITGLTEKTLTKRYEFYNESNNKVKSLETLDQLITLRPNEKSYLKMKAANLIDQGDRQAASDIYSKVLELDPNDTDANLNILSQPGTTKEYGNAYLRTLLPLIKNQSINIDVKIIELMPFLNSLTKSTDLDFAASLKEVGSKLTLTHPGEAKAHAFYADVLYNTNDMDKAIAEYKRTLELDDKNYLIWEQLMYSLDYQKSYIELEKTATNALDLFPNKAINYFFLSKALVQQKKYKDASDYIEEGMMVAASNKVIASKIKYVDALSLFNQSKLPKAKETAQLSISLSDNKNAMAYELLGDISLAAGDSKGAREAWIRSRDLGNTGEGLKEKLITIGQ